MVIAPALRRSKVVIKASKDFHIQDLRQQEIQNGFLINPQFTRMGSIFAKGGTRSVEVGHSMGFRKLTIPRDLTTCSVRKRAPAPMPTAQLFHPNTLSLHPGLLCALSKVQVCIGRGVLVKLLHAVDEMSQSARYKIDFVFNLHKHLFDGKTYLVVTDSEPWVVEPAYGHGVADRLTTLVDEKYRRWYHYDYQVLDFGGSPDFSILLRSEVDALTDDGAHVEIKSYNADHVPDMAHIALCVWTAQTDCLCLVSRKRTMLRTIDVHARDDLLDNFLARDRLLERLGMVRRLFQSVLVEMEAEGEGAEARLMFHMPADHTSSFLRFTLLETRSSSVR